MGYRNHPDCLHTLPEAKAKAETANPGMKRFHASVLYIFENLQAP